jgi:Protein of unknown function (DUF2934)
MTALEVVCVVDANRGHRSLAVPSIKPPPFDPLRFAQPPADSRERLIAEMAYFKALERGFEPGHEMEDWLEAEAELNRNSGRKA